MHKNAIGALLVLAGAVAMAASPAAAFHGAAYTARGTAALTLTGEIYDAVVRWSGAFGIGGGTYTIELYEQDTGSLFHKNSVSGKEELNNVHFLDNCVEYVDYVGSGSLPGGVISISGTLNPVFRIEGWQLNNLCTGIANMHYEGHYLKVFEMSVDVWGPPGA